MECRPPSWTKRAKFPSSYCPTCAVAIGAARTPLLAKQIRVVLMDAPNTGQKKFEMGIENRYIVKGGGVKVDLLAKGEVLLAKNVRGCCMADGTAKAEIVAGLVSEAQASSSSRPTATSAPSSTAGWKSPWERQAT